MSDDTKWKVVRFTTPSDNEALGRYFAKLSQVIPEERARIDAEFDKAIDEGLRPKEAVRRALGELQTLEEAQVELAESRASDKAARDCLRRIRQWDMISPPNRELLEDGLWLARLIDECLGEK